jgi:hypothetical protein
MAGLQAGHRFFIAGNMLPGFGRRLPVPFPSDWEC